MHGEVVAFLIKANKIAKILQIYIYIYNVKWTFDFWSCCKTYHIVHK